MGRAGVELREQETRLRAAGVANDETGQREAVLDEILWNMLVSCVRWNTFGGGSGEGDDYWGKWRGGSSGMFDLLIFGWFGGWCMLTVGECSDGSDEYVGYLLGQLVRYRC